MGLLDLVDDRLVLEDLAVMSKVNGRLLVLEIRQHTTGLFVALAEGAQGGDSLGLEAEGGRQLGPVDVGGGGLDSRHDEFKREGWSGEMKKEDEKDDRFCPLLKKNYLRSLQSSVSFSLWPNTLIG